jgi:hypothetical protein
MYSRAPLKNTTPEVPEALTPSKARPLREQLSAGVENSISQKTTARNIDDPAACPMAARSAVFDGRTRCSLHGFAGLRHPVSLNSKSTAHREISSIRFELYYLDIGWCSTRSIGELGITNAQCELEQAVIANHGSQSVFASKFRVEQ